MTRDRKSAASAGWQRLMLAVALVGAVGAFSGCAMWPWGSDSGGDGQWSGAEPDDDGLYAYNGDDLVRLDGNEDWEKKTWDDRSSLPPNSEFVIRDPALKSIDGSGMGVVGLQKVAWVRSVVTPDGDIAPVSGSQWQSAPLPELAVPLVFARRTKPDLIRVRTREPLKPGLYEIYLEKDEQVRKARFGVGWPKADRQAYASSVCVDRLAGLRAAYRPCSGKSASEHAKPLQIYLVKPEVQESSSGRTMVISGVVVNSSGQAQSIPVLVAELRDTNGQPLTSWRFRAASTKVEPQQSVSFRTVVEHAPQYVHTVKINFAAPRASVN